MEPQAGGKGQTVVTTVSTSFDNHFHIDPEMEGQRRQMVHGGIYMDLMASLHRTGSETLSPH